jgi:hypothetical protein
MKTPSRKMPAAPTRKTSWWAWPILALLLGALIFWIFVTPFLLATLIAFAVFLWIQTISFNQQRRRLAASRSSETICQFARSFDRRTDTWILRAVYEELSKYLAVDGQPMPVHAEDNWKSDLKIDAEDLDDLSCDVASRSGRSMEGAEHNPFYGEVHTVRDIVAFLQNQPRVLVPGRIS